MAEGRELSREHRSNDCLVGLYLSQVLKITVRAAFCSTHVGYTTEVIVYYNAIILSYRVHPIL